MPQQEEQPTTEAQDDSKADEKSSGPQANAHQGPTRGLPPAMRQRGNEGCPLNNPHDTPLMKFMVPFSNAGKGACLYLSTAEGLSDISPAQRTLSTKDTGSLLTRRLREGSSRRHKK